MCDDHSDEKPDLSEGGTVANRTNDRLVSVCISWRRSGTSLFAMLEKEQPICMDKRESGSVPQAE